MAGPLLPPPGTAILSQYPSGEEKEGADACWDWGSWELLGKLTWHGGQNDRVEIRSASEGGKKSPRDGREGPKRASAATQRTG